MDNFTLTAAGRYPLYSVVVPSVFEMESSQQSEFEYGEEQPLMLDQVSCHGNLVF